MDINLGGERSGIQLASDLRAQFPHLEVVFVTGYDEYAREAYRVGGRAYLTKPYSQEELNIILDMLEKLTRLHQDEGKLPIRIIPGVKIKTFGNFDLLVDNLPVAFKNSKAKELLAVLIDHRGGTVSSAQLFLSLWEHIEYTSTTSTYVRRTVRALRDELESHGLANILICKRNCYSVDTSSFICDYYDLMNGSQDAADQYNGEYMNQYSWGETTVPLIDRKLASMTSRV